MALTKIEHFHAAVIIAEPAGIVDDFSSPMVPSMEIYGIAKVLVTGKLCIQYVDGSLDVGFRAMGIYQFFLAIKFIRRHWSVGSTL